MKAKQKTKSNGLAYLVQFTEKENIGLMFFWILQYDYIITAFNNLRRHRDSTMQTQHNTVK